MFAGFEGHWTPVAFAEEISGKPLGITVAGESVVLFRGAEGLSALVDRCPHRGVRLSLGRVTESGCLECPFHGWQFRGDGACAVVPMNDVPEVRKARLGATALPVRERAGLVWLFTGARAEGEPDVPEMLLQRGVVVRHTGPIFEAHWTRVMENMLDSPHLPFVHRKTIGGPLKRALKRGAKVAFDLEDTPFGFRQRTRVDGVAQGWIEWHRPNAMVLDIPIPGMHTRLHVWCVPVEEGRTRLMLASAREMAWYNPARFAFSFYEDRVLFEDKAVVESHDPPEVPEPRHEQHVTSDRATLRFRQWYLGGERMLRRAQGG